MLEKVKSAVQKGLEQGQPRQAVASVQQVLDDAGVSPTNPQYAEMVFRTNAMSAYNAGSSKEMQDPDVAESFPVWQWAAIMDDRVRDSHAERNGNYYPNDQSFEDVRDADGFDGFNDRCTSIPIYVDDWNDLQADGAEVSAFAEKFHEAGQLRAYLERFCGGVGSGRPGPCPGEGGRSGMGPAPVASGQAAAPQSPEQLHAAADQVATRETGLFKRMISAVKNLPVVKQLTQLHSYAQLQAVHLYNGLAARYGTANANAIFAKGMMAGAGGGFSLAVGQKFATVASAGVAEAYRLVTGKHAEETGQVDMALVDREAKTFLATMAGKLQAHTQGQQFDELRKFCGGKGGKPGPCPEPKDTANGGIAEPAAAEKVQGHQIASGIRGRLKAGVGKILSGIDSATHGSISLLAAGHPAQAAAQAFNSVFHSVHQEVYEASLSEHSIPGAAVVAGVGAKVATAAQRGLLKGVSWAMGKLVGKHAEHAPIGQLSAADQSLLDQLTDLAAQELASLGLQPDRQRLAWRILAALRQQPTAHAEIPAATVPQSRSWTCGPAALASAAQALGLSVNEAQAQQVLGATPDEGTPPEDILAGAKALGLHAVARERMTLAELEAELAAGHPVIVCMVAAWESAKVTDESGHWATVTGADQQGVTLADPAAGKVRLSPNEFVQRWADKDSEDRPYVRLGVAVSLGQ